MYQLTNFTCSTVQCRVITTRNNYLYEGSYVKITWEEVTFVLVHIFFSFISCHHMILIISFLKFLQVALWYFKDDRFRIASEEWIILRWVIWTSFYWLVKVILGRLMEYLPNNWILDWVLRGGQISLAQKHLYTCVWC